MRPQRIERRSRQAAAGDAARLLEPRLECLGMPAASLSKARQAEEVKALQEGGRVGKQLQAVRGSAGSPTALRALGCSAGGPPEDLPA